MDRVAVYCHARGFVVEMVACYIVLLAEHQQTATKNTRKPLTS